MLLRDAIKTKLSEKFAGFKQNQDPGEDDFFILNARKRRRIDQANQKRAQRRGQAAWSRRQIMRQSVAGDLAYQFAILDGLEPARESTRLRVQQSVDAKAQAAADDQGVTLDEAYALLRQIANGAPAPSRPRVRYDRGGILSTGLTPVTNRTSLPEYVTIGRTGRAG